MTKDSNSIKTEESSEIWNLRLYVAGRHLNP